MPWGGIVSGAAVAKRQSILASASEVVPTDCGRCLLQVAALINAITPVIELERSRHPTAW